MSATVMETKGLFRVLRGLLENLSPQERRIVALRFGADLSQDDIAQSLSMRRSTVSKRIKKILKTLRLGLTDAGFAGVNSLLTPSMIGDCICSEHPVPRDLPQRIQDAITRDTSTAVLKPHRPHDSLRQHPGRARETSSANVQVLERTPELMADVRALSKVSNVRGAWAILRQWLVIGAAVSLVVWLQHWGAYVLAGLVIATRQHTLGIIMHDATHGRLFTNTKIAEWVSDFFCAFPTGLSTELYRRQHLAHHYHPNTQDDPYWKAMSQEEEWEWPKAARETMRLFFFDFIGVHANKLIKWTCAWSPYVNFFQPPQSGVRLSRSEKFRFLCFVALLGTLLVLTNGWWLYFSLWIVPSLTVLVAFIRLRGTAEHLALPNEHELNNTRHVDGSLLERHSISPLNINYHIDHHLFPSVPYYNLPRLHKRLMQVPAYRSQAHLTSTYTSLRDGVLAQLIRK